MGGPSAPSERHSRSQPTHSFRTCSLQVGNVDFAPTWVELAGIEDPLAATRDGISLVPILLGQPDVLENPEHHRVGILVSGLPSFRGLFFVCAQGRGQHYVLQGVGC